MKNSVFNFLGRAILKCKSIKEGIVVAMKEVVFLNEHGTDLVRFFWYESLKARASNVCQQLTRFTPAVQNGRYSLVSLIAMGV